MAIRIDRAEAPRPAEIARVLAPPALASSLVAAGLATLRATRIASAAKVARFINLSAASLLVGNGFGTLLATHPALRSLPARSFFEAERALTWRYAEVMRTLMAVALVSCLAVLRLTRDRRSASYRLALAGTAAMAGVPATTAVELPLNKQALQTSPGSDAELSDWLASRGRWDRVNLLRNGFTVATWGLLCLATLTKTED